MKVEFRKSFDTIPEQFDKYRPKYSEELFQDLISYARVDEQSTVLELGPGTGQATEPILRTGCNYHAIELGENLAEKLTDKYGHYSNFNLMVDDFITHDFGGQMFDMIYSAATIQWIPEEVAFSKTFSLLKPGGTLAMMLTREDYKTANETLYNQIQKVYAESFRPDEDYNQLRFHYDNATNFGFVDFNRSEFYGQRIYTADEYVAYAGTHCDHILLSEPYRRRFFDGLHKAVMDAGDRITFNDTYILMTVKKPE